MTNPGSRSVHDPVGCPSGAVRDRTGSSSGVRYARDEDGEERITVVVPSEPPTLTPAAAECLLRLIRRAASDRHDEDTSERRAA